MSRLFMTFALIAASALGASGQEKTDYEELSRLIHGLVAKGAPKAFEEKSEWGKSTPFPEKLRLPNLPRTTIKVGDRIELAHGNWKRAKMWLEDPEKDLGVTVTSFKQLEGSKVRLTLIATANLQSEGEMQQWLNGLMLVALTARAGAKVQGDIECDVNLSLDVKKFPPELMIDPKITRCDLELKEFTLFKPTEARNPERAEGINGQLKNALQSMLKNSEPTIREAANKAIAQALREGKGSISAAALYNAMNAKKKS